MRIKMTVHIGGFRNGAEWPAAGFCWDVPDEEAADLILAGYAKEATDEDPDHPGTAEWEPDAAADGDPAGGPVDDPAGDGSGDGGTAATGDEGDNAPAGPVTDPAPPAPAPVKAAAKSAAAAKKSAAKATKAAAKAAAK